MMNSIYWIALTLGVFSTLHCWGMCGGIVTALSVAVPGNIRKNRRQFGSIVLAYNSGRILTYTVLGLIAGFLGANIANSLFIESGQRFLQGIAGVVLVGIGLNMSGYLPWAKNIESFGYRVWGYIRPVGRMLLPLDNIFRALAMGMVWGLLPCALVYSVLLISITSANYLDGGLIMLVFGLGTLPGMLVAGYFGGQISRSGHAQTVRYVAAACVIALGIYMLFIAFQDPQLHSHLHHSLHGAH